MIPIGINTNDFNTFKPNSSLRYTYWSGIIHGNTQLTTLSRPKPIYLISWKTCAWLIPIVNTWPEKAFHSDMCNTQGSKKESKISYNFQKIFATTNTTIQLRSISVSSFPNICILNFILYPHYSLWSRISALGNNSHWRLRGAATNPTMVAFVPCKKSNSCSRLNDRVAGLAGLTSKIGFQVILRLSGFRFNSNYFALCNLHKKFYLIYLVHRVM